MDASNRTDPKPRVLIVDDEPLVRMTIADMLRLGGFEVLEAGAGTQALQLLSASEQPVVALVSDVRMPGINGVDLSHQVRSAHPQMPIVLVSGDTQPDPTQLPVGTRFLRKPARLRELVATVFQAIADPHTATSPNPA
jgi:two-component system, response regulator PdtaR